MLEEAGEQIRVCVWRDVQNDDGGETCIDRCAVQGWGKVAHMSQIVPGFSGEKVSRKVQATNVILRFRSMWMWM